MVSGWKAASKASGVNSPRPVSYTHLAVAENGSQDFTVIANSGYSISSVTVDGGAIVERKAEGTYTVKNVTKNCTVTATFSKNSSSGGGGGSVTTKYTLSFDTNGGDVYKRQGRSDFPNQINNVLVFPGLFKGALSCGAVQITEAVSYTHLNTGCGCFL